MRKDRFLERAASKIRITALAAFLLPAGGIDADTGSRPVSGELRATKPFFRPGATTVLALSLVPEPGWHTYWINPGEAGMAPAFSWTLPPGFEAEDVRWPVPERIEDAGITTLGYPGDITAFVRLRVSKTAPHSRVRIRVGLDLLACRETCLPVSLALECELVPRGGNVPDSSGEDKRFSAFRKKLPLNRSNWKVEARRTPDSLVLVLAYAGTPPGAVEDVDFFPFEPGSVLPRPKRTVRDAPNRFRVVFHPASSQAFAPRETLAGILAARPGWLEDPKRRGLVIRTVIRSGREE
jgi:thiol:disulfide interchange protein DsbD